MKWGLLIFFCVVRVNSLNIVLEQEVERYKKLLHVILTTLRTLKKAIAGFVVMGERMEKLYKSVMNSQVGKLYEKQQLTMQAPKR